MLSNPTAHVRPTLEKITYLSFSKEGFLKTPHVPVKDSVNFAHVGALRALHISLLQSSLSFSLHHFWSVHRPHFCEGEKNVLLCKMR